MQTGGGGYGGAKIETKNAIHVKDIFTRTFINNIRLPFLILIIYVITFAFQKNNTPIQVETIVPKLLSGTSHDPRAVKIKNAYKIIFLIFLVP